MRALGCFLALVLVIGLLLALGLVSSVLDPRVRTIIEAVH